MKAVELKTEESPWLRARLEYDSRVGPLIKQALNWRRAFWGMTCISSLLGTALIVQISRAQFRVWIVGADSTGRVVYSGMADHASSLTDANKRTAIEDWVGNMRMVTTDPIVQRKAVDRVFSMVAGSSPADIRLKEYFRNDKNNPFKRMATETVSVDVQSVVASSDRTYQVEWTETGRSLAGQEETKTRWRGAFTVRIAPPETAEAARKNPLGLFVTQADWSMISGG